MLEVEVCSCRFSFAAVSSNDRFSLFCQLVPLPSTREAEKERDRLREIALWSDRTTQPSSCYIYHPQRRLSRARRRKESQRLLLVLVSHFRFNIHGLFGLVQSDFILPCFQNVPYEGELGETDSQLTIRLEGMRFG